MTSDDHPPKTSVTDTGAQVRRLIRASDRATLSTVLQRDGAPWPYGSLVLTACEQNGTPLLLISDLAEHTRNIAEGPRVSLLFDGTAGLEDPLTGARGTLLGHATRIDDDRARSRYLARQPTAAGYADFADFHFYRVIPESAHLVAGFGRIAWADGADLLLENHACAGLAEAESGIIAHMNADHADALGLYARVLLGRPAAEWRMTGIDPEGTDLRAGGSVARLDFGSPVASAEQARAALVRLAKIALENGARTGR